MGYISFHSIVILENETIPPQNHDNQPNISHFMEIQREMLVAPKSYTRLAPPGVGGEGGQGNYWVPVRTLPSHHFLSSDRVYFLSRHRCIIAIGRQTDSHPLVLRLPRRKVPRKRDDHT
jgi:hypothetical protein